MLTIEAAANQIIVFGIIPRKQSAFIFQELTHNVRRYHSAFNMIVEIDDMRICVSKNSPLRLNIKSDDPGTHKRFNPYCPVIHDDTLLNQGHQFCLYPLYFYRRYKHTFIHFAFLFAALGLFSDIGSPR